MGELRQLLNLASKVAKKTRQLIPRSANRGGKGKLEDGIYSDSYWATSNIPTYILMQLRAMRAGSSANKIRQYIDTRNPDLQYRWGD